MYSVIENNNHIDQLVSEHQAERLKQTIEYEIKDHKELRDYFESIYPEGTKIKSTFKSDSFVYNHNDNTVEIVKTVVIGKVLYSFCEGLLFRVDILDNLQTVNLDLFDCDESVDIHVKDDIGSHIVGEGPKLNLFCDNVGSMGRSLLDTVYRSVSNINSGEFKVKFITYDQLEHVDPEYVESILVSEEKHIPVLEYKDKITSIVLTPENAKYIHELPNIETALVKFHDERLTNLEFDQVAFIPPVFSNIKLSELPKSKNYYLVSPAYSVIDTEVEYVDFSKCLVERNVSRFLKSVDFQKLPTKLIKISGHTFQFFDENDKVKSARSVTKDD